MKRWMPPYAKCAAEESSTGEQLVEAVKSAIDTEARYKRALIEKLVQDCIKLKFSLPEIRRRLNRDFKDIIQEDNETYAPRFRIRTMIKEATNRK